MSSRLSRTILIFFIASGLILGAGAVAFSQIPFEWLKPRIDSLSVDGDAGKFTLPVFSRITARAQWAGVGLILLSCILAWQRKRLQGGLENLGTSLSDSFEDLTRDTDQYLRSILQDESRLHLSLLAILIAGGFFFRLNFLFQPMRHDEAFTFTNYASKPLVLALSNYSFPNNHLFHSLCAHLSYLVFGNQNWAIRLPAFLAGIFTIPIAYLLARMLYNARAALFATGFIAFSSALVEYATNARGYALIVFFFLCISALAQMLHKKDNTAAWLLFAVLSALGLYTVPTMLYPFCAVMVWILISAWKDDFSTGLRQTCYNLIFTGLFTGCLTALFYLPVIMGSGLDAITSNRFVQSASLAAFIESLPNRLSLVWIQWTRDLPLELSFLFGLIALIGLIRHKHLAKHRIPFAAIVPITLVAILTIQTVIPPPRAWLYLLPLFFMLVGASLSDLMQKIPFKHASTLCLVILAALTSTGAARAMASYYPYGPGTLNDAEEITQYLDTYFQPHDRLLTVATAAPLEYYFLKHNVPIAYTRRSFAQSERIILIVLEYKYTLHQVLQTANVPEIFTPPRLLKTYPSARLYLLTRKETAQHNR